MFIGGFLLILPKDLICVNRAISLGREGQVATCPFGARSRA